MTGQITLPLGMRLPALFGVCRVRRETRLCDLPGRRRQDLRPAALRALRQAAGAERRFLSRAPRSARERAAVGEPGRAVPMTEPDDIDATIALWQRGGITASEAWRALGHSWSWAVEWWEVRAAMRRLEPTLVQPEAGYRRAA